MSSLCSSGNYLFRSPFVPGRYRFDHRRQPNDGAVEALTADSESVTLEVDLLSNSFASVWQIDLMDALFMLTRGGTE